MHDLSRPCKVKCHWVIGLPIYGFLLIFNRNLERNSAPLREIKLPNLGDLDSDLSGSLKLKCDGVIGLHIYGLINIGDLEFDLSRSIKVKCDGATALPIYGFLLIFNSSIGPN